MTRTTAAVCRPGDALFQVEELTVGDPRPDEVLVRFTAAGLCHTDLAVAAGRMPTPLPVVAGHEGTGVVEAVVSAGSGLVTGASGGASLNVCGELRDSLSRLPAYLPAHVPLNFGAH